MTNLYVRLKPEHRLTLEKVKETYPNTYDDIVRELTKTAFWTQLKVGIAGELCSHLGVAFSIHNLTDLFNDK